VPHPSVPRFKTDDRAAAIMEAAFAGTKYERRGVSVFRHMDCVVDHVVSVHILPS
jgi:hypothetical protein